MVAEGYKNTEIGEIPKDWKVKAIGDIGEIKMCKRIFQNQTTSVGDIPFYKIGTFAKKADAFISEELFSLYKRQYSYPRKGEILISAAGTIGRTLIFDDKPSYFQDSNIVWVENNENLVSNKLLYYLFQIIKYNTEGGTIQRLYNTILKNATFPLPPLSEQNAIATALSDADALISATERLIAKKKAIKQGAMQELLKPKEGWEEKALGEVAEIRKGQLITEKTSVLGNVPVVGGGVEVSYYHNTANREGTTITISASGANAGYVSIHNYPIFASDCSTIGESTEYDIKFIYYFLLKEQKSIYKMQTGGAQPHIYPKQLYYINIYLPKSKSEQTRIATILSDMDAEISLLEQKLEKQKQIKQGMMQSLLTGKIRLLGNKEEQVKKPKHNEQINEAVIISFLVHKFGTEKYPLSRFRYTKYAYLLHRQSEREARGFDKYAAGPYNPANRYKGAEDIAVKNKYITKVQNPTSQNDAFVVNENIEEALNYFQEWYGTEIQQWIEQFKFYKNEYLEVLTTIDKAICELIRKKIIIDVPNIKSYIASIPQWKNKLEKPYFSDIEIQRAIDESNKLFGNG